MQRSAIGILDAMNRLCRDVDGGALAPGGSVVCIGAFDGLHGGHRAVLDHVRTRAAASGLVAAVVSFAPIPRVFFAGERVLPQLSSVREKVEGFFALGMQQQLLLRFDQALAAMSAEAFVEKVLLQRLNAREIWVGENFRFGHARKGDLALLQAMGRSAGFSAGVVPVFSIDGERVSSSRIRGLLGVSDFDAAARLLGRRFSIGGHVVYGQQLGRKLGYPTANVRLGPRTSPVGGVFAARVHGIDSEALPAVASLGVRPTVNGKEPLLEAHLFDFDRDLYGKKIQVEFIQKLRDEEKFDGLDAMVRQIDRDAALAREILECSPTSISSP